MNKHKYLSSISASSVLSKHFNTGNHEITKSSCISFNVLVKGFIPLAEEPLPRQLGNIATDVREGGVRFCGIYADEVHKNLKMGCKISSSNYSKKFGTLGGFAEHDDYGLCGFTCAHIVLRWNEELVKLKGMSTYKIEDLNKQWDIYQPSKNPENRVGKLVEMIFKEGGNVSDDKPGVDLAIFKIDKCAPVDGSFPDSGPGDSSPKATQPAQLSAKSYKSGLVWRKTGIPTGNIEVQKFGCESDRTHGIIQFNNTAIKVSLPFEKDFIGKGEQSHLYRQYHVKSSNEKINFCKLGDSGALVFMEDHSGNETDLRCIGMVVALMDDNSCIVTPITPILDELKVNLLKPFISNNIIDQMNRGFEEVKQMIRDLKEGLTSQEDKNKK